MGCFAWWLFVPAVAAAWVEAGPFGEPSALQAPVWVRQYVRNCGQVMPSVFPHFSRVLQSLRQCSSIGCAPKGGDCAPADDDPMTATTRAIKGAAISPRMSSSRFPPSLQLRHISTFLSRLGARVCPNDGPVTVSAHVRNRRRLPSLLGLARLDHHHRGASARQRIHPRLGRSHEQ